MQIYAKEIDNPKLLNPITLAFVGDAVYEMLVRDMLALSGQFPANRLHEQTVKYVCANAQAQAYDALVPVLNEEELAVLKRGRNANNTKAPKNVNVVNYRKATGIEALIGFLHLKGEHARVQELFFAICQAIGSGPQQPIAQTEPQPD